jgi:hypothetical protein
MKKKSTDCAHIQQLLSSDANDKYDNTISEHLKSCTECQQYADGVEMIRNNYSSDRARDMIVPNPEIKKELLSYMQSREKSDSSFWPWIKRVINYRIPAYQVATAAAVILILFLTIDYLPDFDQKIYSSSPSEIFPQNPEFSQINLIDSLNLSGLQNIGRNALEDSAITKYLVGSL